MDIFYLDNKNFLQSEIDEIIAQSNMTFSSSKRQREYALGRFVVNYVAQNFYKIKYPKIEIKDKKPYFPDCDLNFSISHSKDIVLVAFDRFPLGADVEFMKKRDYTKLFYYYKLLPESSDAETFYRFWTEYEAEIKLQSKPQSTLTMKLLPEYILTLASNQSFDIRAMLRIYELKSPRASTKPNELMSLKLVNASIPNENTVVIQEINTASLEFFDPLNLKTE